MIYESWTTREEGRRKGEKKRGKDGGREEGRKIPKPQNVFEVCQKKEGGGGGGKKSKIQNQVRGL